MRRPFTLALVGALAFTAIAAGDVDTAHECYDETTDSMAYDTEQVWFHAGDSKLGNNDAATWDTTAPTASVQAGAGAGAATSSAALADIGGTDTVGATFTGTFDGCIDTVAFDVFSFDPTNRSGTSATAQPAAHDFSISVAVDGTEILKTGAVEGTTTFSNEGFGPNLTQFALNLGETLELYASFDPSITLAGEHEITITIAAWYANTGHAVYVWDTTEVPAGMTFNATDLGDEYVFVG